jgi:serine/threonine protein kinase
VACASHVATRLVPLPRLLGRATPGPTTPARRPDPLVGQTLGAYRLLALIGKGGLGRIYHARHERLGRDVALKLLKPEAASRRDAVVRFMREARLVNRVGHPNIVDVIDLVELPTGEVFLVMDLLEGVDLARLRSESDQPIPLQRAIHIALQVCDALAAVHRAGIVHRDLKPENIFIATDAAGRDHVKLLDFGVARLVEGTDDDDLETVAGLILGTPAYMSPEQAAGQKVDARSDIYSLGAVLYTLFTGHALFRGRSFELLDKHLNDAPVPPRALPDAPRIPAALEQVIMTCLEKDPDRRYRSAPELQAALSRATATVETVVMQVTPPPLPPPVCHGRTVRIRAPHSVLLALAAVLVATLAALLVALPGGRGDAPADAASTQAGVDPQAGTVRIRLLSRPSGAEVFRQGDLAVTLGRTPLDLDLRQSDRVEAFIFHLPGHHNRLARASLDGDAVVEVDLDPERP